MFVCCWLVCYTCVCLFFLGCLLVYVIVIGCLRCGFGCLWYLLSCLLFAAVCLWFSLFVLVLFVVLICLRLTVGVLRVFVYCLFALR